jgi:PKD repeat protein
MITIPKTLPRLRRLLTTGVAALALLTSAQQAQAFNGILQDFEAEYPASNSANNASCQLCHGSSTSTWNEYGWGLRQNGQNFAALEGLPSININGGTTMLDEINASTQPGWTTGNNNNLYNDTGLTANNALPPGGIAGDLDPPTGNLPPVADANGPYNGTAGVTLITFDGSASNDPDGTIVAYDWTFGDGGTGTGVNPTYTYAAAGTYTVTLTVTDDGGLTDTATATANIVAAPQDPIADPNGPYNGFEGVALTLDGSASFDPDGGNITAYDWDFGDGNTGVGVSPTHSYVAAGTYTVTLTVVDDEGAQSAPATTTATIDTAIVDLDIAQFKVTKRVRLARVKPVGIQLTVKNNGTIEGDAPATVVGVQNGVEVYNETATVTDAVGNGRTKFDFPAYIPTDAGDIVWTATIADGDPDDDTELATTTVVQ